MQYDSDRPFPHNFTQEDRDTFYRMKFKALNKKIGGGGVADPGQQMLPRRAHNDDEEEDGKEGDEGQQLDLKNVPVERFLYSTNKKIQELEDMIGRTSCLLNTRLDDVEASVRD